MDLNPNLVVLGAQKSGTTTLTGILDQHPQVFMSKPVTEPAWYYPDEAMLNYIRKYRRTKRVASRSELLKRHMLQDYAGEKYVGEASTGYTYYENSKKLASLLL